MYEILKIVFFIGKFVVQVNNFFGKIFWKFNSGKGL